MSTSSRKKTSNSRKTNTKGSRSSAKAKAAQDEKLYREIGLIVLFVLMLLLFCCNFGIIGPVGNAISSFLFGLFGFSAYLAPILLFLAVAFWLANEGNPVAVRKLIAGAVLFLMFGVVCELIVGTAHSMDLYQVATLYEEDSVNRHGGGVLAGSVAYLLLHTLEMVGTVLVVILISLICAILLTERSFLDSLKKGREHIRERMEYEEEPIYDEADDALSTAREERATRRAREREEEAGHREEARRLREEEKRRLREEKALRAEEAENERILNANVPRVQRKVTGVTRDTMLKHPANAASEDMHEITYDEQTDEGSHESELPTQENTVMPQSNLSGMDSIQIRRAHQVHVNDLSELSFEDETRTEEPILFGAEHIRIHKEGEDAPEPAELEALQEAEETPVVSRPRAVPPRPKTPKEEQMEILTSGNAAAPAPKRTRPSSEYRFPSLNLLSKGKAATGDSSRELKETALRLQQTLDTFGVKVTITDISQGPSVTRYELQPEQGVKVSKIVGLSDDIKLNLAATDIRIEAPIPGKAAVGIEVPNKENMTVALRDLLESKEFKEFPSNIAFAVGKDIAGKTVVTDIAKMPHMLIAGATGSGKSVCINTLIMSILYKAHPDDVKLIMVDPKVVELSVYNGIPHLLIPVVTDPKKASAALHWGVSEMEERYRLFADYNVRDLKGYNQKIASMTPAEGEEAPKKMPQIVIIVDELADLMMVCPGEVEESICRLAQLARAAGIHLIIATQRPSVDVITGLIKANMPSRVAFSVSSGVDSRTILDMNGAEKLLGKGDMLFYPQGYSKPARVQGAFVSDKEVSDVVDFLKNQAIGNVYAEEIEEKIQSIGSGSSSSGTGASGNSDNGRDEYFEEAGRFIIDKDKASIGMLQRVLKIGFNRAARIMDQLCDYGVVGEEEGTKPRKVLMSMEQFEQLLEEI